MAEVCGSIGREMGEEDIVRMWNVRKLGDLGSLVKGSNSEFYVNSDSTN